MPDRWTSADPYEDYVGRWSRLLAPTFLQWAGLPRGARVVDVGCGTGALSEAVLATRPRALVGVDLSPAYVEASRQRFGRGEGERRFEVANATALPFADASVDAAVSGLVLNFVPEPAAMVREMRRVLVPGGLAAAYVWDYAGKMELMRAFWDAARDLDPRAAALDEGARFPVCEPAALARLFADAGFERVETHAIDQPTVFRDFDDYWRPFLGGQGPAPGYAMSLGEKPREALREAIRARLRDRAMPDGTIPLVARAWAVKGRVP